MKWQNKNFIFWPDRHFNSTNLVQMNSLVKVVDFDSTRCKPHPNDDVLNKLHRKLNLKLLKIVENILGKLSTKDNWSQRIFGVRSGIFGADFSYTAISGGRKWVYELWILVLFVLFFFECLVFIEKLHSNAGDWNCALIFFFFLETTKWCWKIPGISI